MSNLNQRIYQELNEWKYNEVLLTEYIRYEKRKLKRINGILIIVSFISVFSWYKFAFLKHLWFLVLLTVQGFRVAQNLILTSNEDLFNIKGSLDFYSFNVFELEKLYYDFHNRRLKDSTIEDKLNTLMNKERELYSKQNFDKINPSNSLIHIAVTETDKYLNKIIKNITNE